ncbi:MAG: hypothetical protein KA165_03295, partial [Saprospiraceae bacterium]|nr:hypothetical protein [Saprospiraceae bacterium]
MKRVFLYLILCFFTPVLPLSAQDCPHYQTLMKRAKLYWDKQQFDLALNQISAAREHCPAMTAEIDAQFLAFAKEIAAKYREAEKAKKQADEEKGKTQAALKKAEAALQKAGKLINAFYFYAGRFAVAEKGIDEEPIYFYIDKNGDEVAKLGIYSKAAQFDEAGFARVSKVGEDDESGEFLLDTFGNTYRVAFSTDALTDNTRALDLRESRQNPFPDAILFPQLEVILAKTRFFFRDTIEVLSGIGGMANLKTLQLENFSLDTLPHEIGSLEQLLHLNVRDNSLRNLPPQ